jgi:peptide/nickel transport system substrate-binding protein
MMRTRVSALLRALSLLTVMLISGTPASGQAPANGKPGGVLNVMQREELPQGFAIHETATISVVFPAAPCFSNLVYFDPFKPTESADTIIGELAERWSWQDNHRTLVFFLRKGVRWHDGHAPDGRAIERPARGTVVEISKVGGLHHRYVRRAA